MIMPHIKTPERKIHTTYGPPSSASSTMPRISGSCSSMLSPPLDSFCEHARALLVENLHDRPRQPAQGCIREQQRDRDAEAEHRCNHGLADTARHQPRIARAGFGDALERDDHADDRADQAEQGASRDGEPQKSLEALELRYLANHGFGDPQLSDVGILLDVPRIALEREEHPAEGVVRAGRVEIEQLPSDPNANRDEQHELNDES